MPGLTSSRLDHDGAWLGRAVHLADSAAYATVRLYHHIGPQIGDLDGARPQRALVDTNPAVFSEATHAKVSSEDRAAHLNFFATQAPERSRGAGLHAGEIVTNNASLRLGINRRLFVLGRIRVRNELYGRDGANLDTLSARGAALKEFLFGERAWRSKQSPANRWRGHAGAIGSSLHGITACGTAVPVPFVRKVQAFHPLLHQLGEGAKEVAEPLSKKAPAVKPLFGPISRMGGVFGLVFRGWSHRVE